MFETKPVNMFMTCTIQITTYLTFIDYTAKLCVCVRARVLNLETQHLL